MARKKYSFIEIKELVEEYDDIILSDPSEFKNTKTKLLLKCNKCEYERHTVVKHMIEKGVRCKKCSGIRQRNTYDKVKNIVEKMDFILLSDKDDDFRVDKKLKTQCPICDTIWFPLLGNLRRGMGCPKCAIEKNKHSFESVKKTIEKKNGILLITKKDYKYTKTKFNIICKICGFNWITTFGRILRGHWCPNCVGKAPHKYEELKELVEKMGGELLSNEYVNNSSPVKVRCLKCNSEWDTSYNQLDGGQWCSKCSLLKSQRKLQDIIQKIIRKPIRHNYRGFGWLRNPETNNKLEIDIWVPDIRLAIEYDGQQHYRPVTFGGVSQKRAEKNFIYIKKRDKIKDKLIKKHNKEVNCFIRIPYTEDLTIDNIKQILTENNILKEKSNANNV